MSPITDDELDVNRLIAKPLHFAMLVNMLIPMALLAICYYFERNQSWSNQVGDSANLLFYVFGAISIAQAGLSVVWRNKLMSQPMIRRKENFENDLLESLMARSKVIFLIIAGISLWGILYFYFTARFQETMFFVIFSFLVFQVIRPRYGFMHKLIARQRDLVEQGTFRQD